jgi:hypothetical protein
LKMQGRREIGRNVGSRVMKVRNMKFANWPFQNVSMTGILIPDSCRKQT